MVFIASNQQSFYVYTANTEAANTYVKSLLNLHCIETDYCTLLHWGLISELLHG